MRRLCESSEFEGAKAVRRRSTKGGASRVQAKQLRLKPKPLFGVVAQVPFFTKGHSVGVASSVEVDQRKASIPHNIYMQAMVS